MGQARTIDERAFRAVKIMLDGGASYAEITEFLKVSSASIGRIRNCQTFEDFKKARQAEAFMAKKAAQEKETAKKQTEEVKVESETKVIHEQSITIQATHYMMQELKQTNEYLKLISTKLCAIIDDLYGTGAK